MYIPQVNEEKRIPVMHELMVSKPFATLVTLGAGVLMASHIPMFLQIDGSELGLLRAHISRANAQWRDFDPTVDVLAIFAGDHHYISPTWYPGTKEHGKVVPTWNYAVVHAYGRLKVIEDEDWLLRHVSSLTNIHEATFSEPWEVGDAPEEYIKSQLRGIVGLEIPIRRLEGKWKVSQNRNEADRKGVVQGLGKLDSPESLSMKSLMEKT